MFSSSAIVIIVISFLIVIFILFHHPIIRGVSSADHLTSTYIICLPSSWTCILGLRSSDLHMPALACIFDLHDLLYIIRISVSDDVLGFILLGLYNTINFRMPCSDDFYSCLFLSVACALFCILYAIFRFFFRMVFFNCIVNYITVYSLVMTRLHIIG